ncbi:hypothetical protein ACFWHT_08965 [Microbacterium sp. NPDC058342]|uniref:hypothetical protein n=1 Tax=Microbacterium sp. NPDC058342 TaxID=3346454 RepID=UPI00364E7C13
MSTSDQDGQARLTRKQLREIRLTGSTPVISEEEAASAAAQPTPVLPRAAEPVEIAPAPPADEPAPGAPLTRRQMRALEHVRAEEQAARAPQPEEPTGNREDAPVTLPTATVAPQTAPASAPAEDQAPSQDQDQDHDQDQEVVSGLPSFDTAPRPTVPRFDAENGEQASAPTDAAADREQVAAIFDQAAVESVDEQEPRNATAADASKATEPERPMVGAAFGIGVKAEHKDPALDSLFDELIDGETSGSQHGAPTALIFTPSLGSGSLSGPIASTGEMLITGTYTLPDGIGSQGHAHGVADGKDLDAMLIDGELAPASSPTPIAASSAISTSKQAGEVIRPPAPDKGNKLMLTLAIVAGGLALALAAALIIAFTTRVLG